MATQTRTLRKGCLLRWMQKPAAGGISREGRGHRGNDGTPGAGGATLPGSISRWRSAFGRPVAVGPGSLCSAVDSGGAERARHRARRQERLPGPRAPLTRHGPGRTAWPHLSSAWGTRGPPAGTETGCWRRVATEAGRRGRGCLASPGQPRTGHASQALCGLGLSVWGESCDRWNEGAGRACPGR